MLVIGVGNPLRGDDGAGRALVEDLAADPRASGVEVLSRAQLTPELAADLAAVRLVVFVDATNDSPPGEVAVRPVRTGEGRLASHHLTPESLLGFAARLYRATPEALLVTIGVEATEPWTGLSKIVRGALPAARELILERIDTIDEP